MRGLEAFCERHLGGSAREVLFDLEGTHHAAGLVLADGRRVVVKRHQARQPRELLEAVVEVQRRHHEAGFPCPRPLAGPEPLGDGFATAEELVDRGELRDTHEPALRRAIAELLVEHLELARGCGPLPALAGNFDLFAGPGLWPERPHDPRFDFPATAAGAEWIDELAAPARPLAAAPGDEVIGHMDWSGEHFRFADGRVTVVYDWDSLALRPEHHVVGVAAATFTANPGFGASLAPSPDESRAFVDEYSAARAEPLSSADRDRIAATAAFVIAYTARCEHADGTDGPHTFTAALSRHGSAYFRKPS